MTSTTESDANWLLIQWTDEAYDVVHLNSVITNPKHKVGEGTVVIADKGNGCHQAATILATASERHVLDKMAYLKSKLVEKKEIQQNVADPDNNDEDKDFSASASSWAPSDENPSTDDEEAEQKKIKTGKERFGRSYTNRRSGKILKPRHRAEAINAIVTKNRKRTISAIKKTLRGNTYKNLTPDSTKKNNTLNPLPNPKSVVVTIDVTEVAHMKQYFNSLFSIIEELKPFLAPNDSTQINDNNTPEQPMIKPEVINNTLYQHYAEDEREMSDRSEDLNRSDDNVLITNKYDTTKHVIPTENDNNQNQPVGEWVPIGSGKTLIHKDKYRKVNWKSYTIATRTLLLAVFPRKILATHSLTGKRSPAFQDKPAKMCLDPKIVSDVIIEITGRFSVKENLVRSIITTKCADECKMFKLRQKQKQNKRKTLPMKQEDKENEDMNDANQTC